MTDDASRAAQAQRLMDDPMLIEILDKIEQAAIDAWASTAMEAVEHREMAYQSLKASRRIRETLKGVVDTVLKDLAESGKEIPKSAQSGK